MMFIYFIVVLYLEPILGGLSIKSHGILKNYSSLLLACTIQDFDKKPFVTANLLRAGRGKECIPDGTCIPSGNLENHQNYMFFSNTTGIYLQIRILSFEADDNTEWVCSFKNFVDRYTIFINIPVSIVTMTANNTGNSVEIEQGRRQVFQCTTNVGRPVSVIQFFLNTTNMTSTASQTDTCVSQCKEGKYISSSILTYIGEKNDNGKNMFCTAFNIKGSEVVTSMNKTISVLYGPEDISIEPPTTSYTVNESGNVGPITCTALCNPDCAISWIGPNQYSNSSVLTLQNITRAMVGDYKCKASNDVNNNTYFAFRVIVNYGPNQINISPANTSYIVNETDNVEPITCTADCYPTCVFSWSGPNLPVAINSSVLRLMNIERNQAGYYHCEAINAFGSLEHKELKIIVNYGPRHVNISTTLPLITVNETDDVGPYHCVADCIPSCTTSWLVRNPPLSIGPVLHLQSINRNQSGRYSCTAFNIIGSKSNSFQINVNYVPIVYDLSGNKTAYENDTVFILCMFNSYPFPDITWKFNDVLFDGADAYVETNSTLWFSKLRLPQIKCLSMGVYSCLAKNIVGEESKAFSVDVYCSPRINPQEDTSKITNITIRYEDPINITVHIIAFPEPFFRWILINNDSTEVINNGISYNKNSRNMYSSSLLISNVSLMDYGYYQIYANNSIEHMMTIVKSYNVIPARKPNSPGNVTCAALMNSVKVYWTPGFDGGDKQSFKIYYKALDSGGLVDTHTVYNETDKKFISALIYPLTPATRYMIYVRASNRYSYSESDATYCNTSKSVPSGNEIDSKSNKSERTLLNAVIGVLVVTILLILSTLAITIAYRLRKKKRQQQKQRSATYTDIEVNNQVFTNTYDILDQDNAMTVNREKKEEIYANMLI